MSIYCERDQAFLPTVAKFAMSVALPGSQKGTHMSRFTQVLYEHVVGKQVKADDFVQLLKDLSARLDANIVHLSAEFPYFLSRPSPVTNLPAVAPYRAKFDFSYMARDEVLGMPLLQSIVEVTVTGQTCCPCSKLISDYDAESQKGKGAHSQRGQVNIKAIPYEGKRVLLEDLIEIAERSVSAPSYPMLKRPDERFATISAYENPCFVEDVLRNAYEELRKDSTVERFKVEVENFEVIHFHNAYGHISYRWIN